MDPDAIENTLSKDTKTVAGPEPTVHDDKTDELVTSLESSVDKAYSTVQGSTLEGLTKLQGLVSEKLPEFQKQLNEVKLPPLPDVKVDQLTKNLKLDEYVKKEDIENLKQRGTEFMTKAGENTNKVLDTLDSDLEKFENATINYAQQIGGQLGTFLKTQLNAGNDEKATSESNSSAQSNSWNWSGWGKQLTEMIVGDSPETVLAQEKKTELLFSLPKGISPGTRAESQVHELQSDASIYLTAVKNGEFKDYKLSEAELSESKELLGNKSLHLIDLYQKIVGSNDSEEAKGEEGEENKINDEDFWKVYFGKKNQIMEDEKKRRELLEKSKNVEENEEDEDFDWDE